MGERLKGHNHKPSQAPLSDTPCPKKSKLVDEILQKLDTAELEESLPEGGVDNLYWKKPRKKKKTK